ncbi:MAG TPA: hypothetical protein VLM17_04730 [Xanthomonadaceae bacterium]|nr:hypothetical protein [Xanthomonadaceae bacterium]
MGKRDEGRPPAPDPRRGKNPGYAEPRPKNREEARQPVARKPAPSPDEPGMRRDPDPPPDPAGKH